jgi:hypothetical protein
MVSELSPLVLTTIQYCVPAATAMPAASPLVSTAQQLPDTRCNFTR